MCSYSLLFVFEIKKLLHQKVRMDGTKVITTEKSIGYNQKPPDGVARSVGERPLRYDSEGFEPAVEAVEIESTDAARNDDSKEGTICCLSCFSFHCLCRCLLKCCLMALKSSLRV